jgi:hypothetical protein
MMPMKQQSSSVELGICPYVRGHVLCAWHDDSEADVKQSEMVLLIPPLAPEVTKV